MESALYHVGNKADFMRLAMICAFLSLYIYLGGAPMRGTLTNLVRDEWGPSLPYPLSPT